MKPLFYVWTFCSMVVGCAGEQSTADETPSHQPDSKTTSTVADPPSMMNNLAHSLKDCQIFSTCACDLGQNLPNITLNEADREQCQAGKQMLDLGDMTQACALARRNLKTLLSDNAAQAEHLGITIPSSCSQL